MTKAINRICKVIYDNSDPEALPIIDIDNPAGGWELQSEEFYVRGADGLELAIYRNTGSGAELKQHNIFAGSDNTGKLTSENGHQYYIKDHLGSIRVVIDPDRQVLSANDFDAWGYYLDNRGYEMVPENETPDYKFTSKDRDRESNYDYFGARYYDSRIGRWGQVEPLMYKYVSFSNYQYSRLNPLKYFDPTGLEEIEIIIRTFIPFNSSGPFQGDNRNFSSELDASYRTQQVLRVETDMNKSNNIIQSFGSDLSITDFAGAKDYGSGEFKYSTTRESYIDGSSKVEINMTGSAKVGVFDNFGIVSDIVVPAIDYNISIVINQSSDGIISYNVNGLVDGFPAYEVLVTDQDNKVKLSHRSDMPTDHILGPFLLYNSSINFKQSLKQNEN